MLKRILKPLRVLSRQSAMAMTLRFHLSTHPMPAKIRESHEYLRQDFLDLSHHILSITDQKELLAFLKENGHMLNDSLLALVSSMIVERHIYLDEEFNEVAVPIICYYIGKMTRDHSPAFGAIMKNFALTEINSPVLWETIGQVYNSQRMYRYVLVQDLTDITINFSLWQKPPMNFFELTVPVLIKHRLRIPDNKKEQLIQGIERVGFTKENLAQLNDTEVKGDNKHLIE